MSSLSLLVLPLVATLSAQAPDKAQGPKKQAEQAQDAKAQDKKTEGKGEKGNAPAKGKVGITFLGHAAFEITSPAGTKLLIDPFLTQNPTTPAEHKNLDAYKPNAILVSHSHFDHVADAEAIATKSGAMVIGAFDHVASMKIPDAQKMGGNVGGAIKVGDDVMVHLVPAMHGSEPGGRPLGFVIQAGGKTIYHTGDTWLFGDMSLIQEVYKPTILLFQAGGGPYNQDPKAAALAIKKYFKPATIIPMHFGTFPPLATEDDVRAAFKKDKRLRVMKPGESAEL